MNELRVAVVGGGAAGIFGAITAAATNPCARVCVFEKAPSFLAKVRISGGGRCNVTHACFDPREFSRNYPRGSRELIGPLHQFSASDTVEWFEARGVRLKIEDDGRMFPVTDSSQTIIDCLLNDCRRLQVELRPNAELKSIEHQPDGGFELSFPSGQTERCDRLLIASGGLKAAGLQSTLARLGHGIEPPVPSLFTFHIELPWLRDLAGVSVPQTMVSVGKTRLRQTGPLLVTHQGRFKTQVKNMATLFTKP